MHRKIIDVFNKLYHKHLLVTNVVTTSVLLGVGDCAVQKIGNHWCSDGICDTTPYDYARTGRMMCIGVILGPFNHCWYTFLDKAVLGFGRTVVAKKVIADQLVAGPFFCSTFVIGMSLMEGEGFEGAINEWKSKFLHIYMVDWTFWPMAQIINFRFIPSRFRVLYVSCATLIWNSFLSYIKHLKPEEDEEEEIGDSSV